MKRTIHFILIPTMLCLAFSAFGQTKRQWVKRGDQAYEINAFNSAVSAYEEAMKKGATDEPDALGRLADSYRHLNKLEDAERNYALASKLKNVPPVHILQYAHTLKGLGRYDDARRWYTEYARTNAVEGNHYAEGCDFAKAQQGVASAYSITNELINTSASEFAPALYGDRIVFASSRMDLQTTTGNWDGKVYNRLYVSSIGRSGGLDSPYFLKSDVRASNSEGPLAFSADGKLVAFTRNNYVEGLRQIPSSGMQLSLFLADVGPNGEWFNTRPFPYNGGSDFSTGYPAFSPDGQALYFASNRPGGFGGYDVYVSNWTGATWGSPENLGAVINTPGNELSPYYDGQSLFFSSDWHHGLGGLDVFRAEQTNNRWARIFHLGQGVNSPYDDYGFVYDTFKNAGYLVSNRNGGRGNEDIYKVSRSSDNISFRITNAADGSPIPNAVVDFTGCGEGVFQADARGLYSFQMVQGLNCNVLIRKEGFQNFTFPLSSISGQSPRDFDVRLIRSGDLFYGSVSDQSNNFVLSGVSVQSTNQFTGITSEVASDGAGSYALALNPNTVYVIRYSRPGYQDVNRTVRTGPAVESNILGAVRLMPVTGSGSLGGDPGQVLPPPSISGQNIPAGFSVQLASLRSPNVDDFGNNLGSLGTIYAKLEGGTYKIRVGVYATRQQADAALRTARQQGYPQAFIVAEKGGNSVAVKGGGATTQPGTPTPPPATSTTTSAYMIQLAALRNPSGFDDSRVRNLGTVINWPKGQFTAKVLTGFSTIDQARIALRSVQSSGFKDAFIVTEENGQLKKVN